MGVLEILRSPELRLGDFLFPWGMGIGALGFLAAWAAIEIAERLGLTPGVWQLPLLFVALAVALGCGLGLVLAP